jgi:hypothetical protein
MNRLRWILFTCLFFWIAVTPSHAQTWPYGTTSYTLTTNTSTDGPCITTTKSYMWTYKDSSGVTHDFPSGDFVTTVRSTNPQVICEGAENIPLNAWSTDGAGYFIHASAQLATISLGGSVFPKYRVLSVIYAPPGSKSYVDYNSSTTVGTTNSWDNSFSTSDTISVSTTLGGGIPVGPSWSASFGSKLSQNWKETYDDSHSITVTNTTSNEVKIPSALNDDLGIDHDYDVVAIWLNPEADFIANSATTATWSYVSDPRDAADEVDYVYLSISQLVNPSTITDTDTLHRLQRTWAGTGQGLTNADLLTIAQRDPFYNLHNTDPSSVNATRFDLVGGTTFPYEPPACGGQPITDIFSQAYQATTTLGRTSTDSYSVTYTQSGGVDFAKWFKANWTASTTETTTNKWSSSNSSTSSIKDTFSITGPADCHYAGQTDVQAYQDNVYGTFMFDFVN